MAVIKEVIRLEADSTLSFGDYLADSKKKVTDFEVNGDLYYVKSYKEITKLEKNSKLLLEAVPGATVHSLEVNDKKVSFSLEGKDDIQITMELEANTEYRVIIGDFNIGNVKANLSGKISFSVDTTDGQKNVVIEKVN